jgi:hypothetical protein
MSVELYAVHLPIDESEYSITLPAKSWAHAEEMAEKIGAKVVGSEVHEVVPIPIPQLMDFITQITDSDFRWKFNAQEQLEAFLAIAWKCEPEELP